MFDITQITRQPESCEFIFTEWRHKKWLLKSKRSRTLILFNIALPRFVTRRHNFYQWFYCDAVFPLSLSLSLAHWCAVALVIVELHHLLARHCGLSRFRWLCFGPCEHFRCTFCPAFNIIKIHEGLYMDHAVNCIKKSQDNQIDSIPHERLHIPLNIETFYSTWTTVCLFICMRAIFPNRKLQLMAFHKSNFAVAFNSKNFTHSCCKL